MNLNIIKKIGKNLILLCYLIFLAFPLFWMVSISLKPTSEIRSLVPKLWPENITFQHYINAFTEQRIIESIFNSAKVGILATIGVILISIPAAYALGRYKTKVNKGVIAWVMVSQLFPAILVMIPLFVVLMNIGLIDSHIGLTILYVVWTLPFVLMMLKGYVQGIPIELEEAAAVDGATRSQILFKVVMPLLLPGIAATSIFAFISAWNEFFFALVLLKSPELLTLPVKLARFTGMEGIVRLGPLAAASFVATIPALILFGFLQKWLVSGLTSGAVKY
ncbi:carbohydrate ABC transporter permease [Halothermothrix orenii]|uniref:Binding-protein-dependent transport systems inner membrane component n=1 Tax=Halothermothrix orenii (strain H 168 / OCM 544 / DSM 9562) TaxID=373903 RepID=B8D1Z1_HALOH|nr:carbohydrate ABC transporter permease [Halothermothrix orenii]ACL69218.1 binding-protein-dependent transport systems inner membrane component [Halothermothrix orenii H 168]